MAAGAAFAGGLEVAPAVSFGRDVVRPCCAAVLPGVVAARRAACRSIVCLEVLDVNAVYIGGGK